MAAWHQDLRYAFRRLLRSPGLAAAAVLSIALGIAANATIFSMVSTFVLRPAPVGDPGTLVSLYSVQHGECCNDSFSAPLLLDLRTQTKSLSGVAASFPLVPASVSGKGDPERVWGQLVTANYFDVAQLRMSLGRGFTSDEERRPVVILSHGLWQRRFDADPGILGKAITLSGHLYTVVGVAPPLFRGLDLILDSEFWAPLGDVEQLIPNVQTGGDRNSRGMSWLTVVGRLQPGVTRAAATAELNVISKRLGNAYPATDKDRSFRLESAGSLPAKYRTAVIAFLGALTVVVLLVLCIACANVVNLLLAQATGRQREMAVRLALGATRARLRRLMLMESTLLALGGGGLGFLLSLWAAQALSVFHLPAPIPIDLRVGVDWTVLLYTLVLSLASGLLFGLVPAWTATRPMLTNGLKGENALVRPGRIWTLGNILVVIQVAMSLVLLCATGLFLRSLQGASAIDIGFRPRGVLMMSVDPQVHGYTTARTQQFLNQLRQRVAALPGVTAAAWTDIAPLSIGGRRDGFQAVGRPKLAEAESSVDLYMVSADYFKTLSIPAIAGHDFGGESATSSRTAVVNQAFAQRFFQNESPLGQSVIGSDVTYRIIGIVRNAKSRTLGEDVQPILYRLLEQNLGTEPSFLGYTLLVRSDGDSANIASAVRHEINAIDPTLAIFNSETMEHHLRDALFLPRLASTLFGVFGLTGLILAAVGLYGMMSYSVSRRTREIGIRIALGAPTNAVQFLVVRKGMLLTAIAVTLGLPAALAAAKLSSSILYGVHPHDFVTFLAVPLFLCVVAWIACWIPARRAARVDPQVALRYE